MGVSTSQFRGSRPAPPTTLRAETTTSCHEKDHEPKQYQYMNPDPEKNQDGNSEVFISTTGMRASSPGGGATRGINDQGFQPSLGTCNRKITSAIMFKDHIMRAATVDIVPYTTIISGIEKCGKTNVLRCLLSNAIIPKYDGQNVTPLLEQNKCCPLSCYKLLILGVLDPSYLECRHLTWLLSATNENSLMCLLSYFAKLSKQHYDNDERLSNWHDFLLFDEMQGNNVSIQTSDPDLDEQICLLHADLRKEWSRMKSDENIQAVIATGMGLLNIYDIGPSKAAKEFLPFLNEYCKRALNLACYSIEKDESLLKKDLSGETHHHYQSKKYHLLRQLSGIHKEELLAIAAITSDDQVDSDSEVTDGLTSAIKKATGIDEVYHLTVSSQTIGETKNRLQQIAINGRYNTPMQLRFILLLQLVIKKSTTFWVKRSKIDEISKLYEFKNGELEEFLKLFGSFGSIFYTHDIPSLREYVIIDVVEFVKQIHILYSSEEATAKFGLVKYRTGEDWGVIFQFLTTLEIATEVKSNQIAADSCDVAFDDATSYYYIPSARHGLLALTHSTCADTFLQCQHIPSAQSGNTSTLPMQGKQNTHCDVASSLENETPIYNLVPVYGHTKENLQASLCKHILQNRECLLIPTTKINTTAIKASFVNPEEIEFIDSGNMLMVRSFQHGLSITPKDREKIKDMITQSNTNRPSFLRRESRQHVIETWKEEKDDKLLIAFIEPDVDRLFGKFKAKDVEFLASKFGLTQEQMVAIRQGSSNTWREIIQCMLLEFARKARVIEYCTILNETLN